MCAGILHDGAVASNLEFFFYPAGVVMLDWLCDPWRARCIVTPRGPVFQSPWTTVVM
jgi:hypothetical protein